MPGPTGLARTAMALIPRTSASCRRRRAAVRGIRRSAARRISRPAAKPASMLAHSRKRTGNPQIADVCPSRHRLTTNRTIGDPEHRDHHAGHPRDAVEHDAGDDHRDRQPRSADPCRPRDRQRREHHGRGRCDAHHQRGETGAAGTDEPGEGHLVEPLLTDPCMCCRQEAEGLMRGDACGGDQAAEGEMPPHVGVAERLHGEHEHDDRGRRNPRDPARGRSPVGGGAGDHEEVGASHWFCAPVFGVALSCRAQTLPGAHRGAGGSLTVDSLSVGTKATLRPSSYTLVQSAA